MSNATLAQGNQLLTLILQAKDPKGFLQSLIGNWGAVQVIGEGRIDQATFLAAIQDVVNRFAGEKTELEWFYPDGWKPVIVEEQLRVLLEVYANLNLDGSHVERHAAGIIVPKDADGLFVVPKPSRIAGSLGIHNDPLVEGYGQLLVAGLLIQLANSQELNNCRDGQLTSDLVRMRQSAADAIRKLEVEQPEGDFLVFAAQTGKKWGGCSPRHARWESEHGDENEFPLPSWCVGHIILTNPARLDGREILGIDCAGDDYRFKDDPAEGFERCLYFSGGRQLKFDYRWLNRAYHRSGAGTGFLQ